MARSGSTGSVTSWFALFPVIALSFPWIVPSSSAAQILMKPYLQAVSEDGVTVMVECDSDDPVTVEYGTTRAYGGIATTSGVARTDAGTFVHRVRLAGLRPDTRYHYRASQGGAPTEDAAFFTAVRPGTAFRCAFFADCRTGTAVHDAIATRMLEVDPPRFSLYGGDLCVTPSYADFKREFFRAPQLALASRVPFFNAPGNHENWTPNTRAFTQAPPPASGGDGYYSFDCGDLHVLVLNNMVDDSPGSAQHRFAEADLASSRRPWKAVVAHYPAWCAGGHDGDADMKALTTGVFEPYGVDLVLAGHNHFYQHNLVLGIHHLVLGSTGAPLAFPDSASFSVRSVRDYSYGILDVSPLALDLAVYNDCGAVLDRINLRKPGPPGAGLMGEYFEAPDLMGPKIVRVDAPVDFDWEDGSPLDGMEAGAFSVRWTGRVVPGRSGAYAFHVEGEGGARLWVNGELLVDRGHGLAGGEGSRPIALVAGKSCPVRLDYFAGSGRSAVRLSWSADSLPRQAVPPVCLRPVAWPADLRDNDGDALVNDVDPDDDNDGLPDLQDPDRDGDGTGNGEEELAGTDPDDGRSTPGARSPFALLGIVLGALGAGAALLLVLKRRR